MRGALDDLAATAQDLLSKLSPAPAAYNASNVKPGNIVRCGAKAQNQSRVKGWTTNKPSVPGFIISSTGCGNDYNFYRTKMGGDNERAVSILTTDVLGALNGEGWPVRVGDLGENLFVDGMRYDVFAIGRGFIFEDGNFGNYGTHRPVRLPLHAAVPHAEVAVRGLHPDARPTEKAYAKVVATGPVASASHGRRAVKGVLPI